MKRLTLEEKYQRIRKACCETFFACDGQPSNVGIHNLGLLHEIGDALGMKGNGGRNLHSLSARINKIIRELIAAGYPIEEHQIRCCSWSPQERLHPMFCWKENYNG